MKREMANEIGRSLTEMLGVLAIIGVLSITAILGYSYAMNKYRANDTINQLTQYALAAAGQMQKNSPILDMPEMDEITRQGYWIKATMLKEKSHFELEVSKVPAKVCEQIVRAGWKMPLIIAVNGVAYTGNLGICTLGNEGTLVQMQFQFNADLDIGATPVQKCVADFECGGDCTKCEQGQCVSACADGTSCATNTATGKRVCCSKDKRAGDYCCVVKKDGKCCDAKGTCCPPETPLASSNGGCYVCDTAAPVPVYNPYSSNCSVCPNRTVINQQCALSCGEGINANKPLLEVNAGCYSCDIPGGVYLWFNAKCSEVCPNRYMAGSICHLNKCAADEIINRGGSCHSCNEPNSTPIDLYGNPDACGKCPNRVLIGGRFCAWPCGEGAYVGKPLYDLFGKCFECNTTATIDVYGVTAICDICPNRKLINNRHCVLK